MSANVLMLGWELPPFNSGGLGVACLGLARALARKGIKITFVLPQKQNINLDFMKLVFADVEDAEKLIKGSYTTYTEWLASLGGNGFGGPHDYLAATFRYAEKIGKIAKKANADIIHAHDWLTYPAAIVAKKLLKKPLVAHVHSTEFDRTAGHSPNEAVFAIEKAGFEYADSVMPVGGFMKHILIDNYKVNAEKIRVVYNGIDGETRKKLPPVLSTFKDLGYKIVLYLGRITLHKGPEYFVRAAGKVSEYDKKVIFVVTGSGDMQDFMISEAARLGILSSFLFTGFLRGDEKDRIYQAADLYVMPSVSEPFGITALEALANGTPALLSKQSGVSEVIKHALKVDFWDIDEMANKILAVLRYPPLPLDLKKESGKEIKTLSWDKSAESVMDVYNQLINRF